MLEQIQANIDRTGTIRAQSLSRAFVRLHVHPERARAEREPKDFLGFRASKIRFIKLGPKQFPSAQGQESKACQLDGARELNVSGLRVVSPEPYSVNTQRNPPFGLG